MKQLKGWSSVAARWCCAAGILLHSEWAVAAPPRLQADAILIEKSERKLTLLLGNKPVKVYRVALGFAPEGKKTTQGDGKTPEGVYRIDSRNPGSHYHKSLHISYPNAADRAQAAKRHVSPGGDVYIHGLGSKFGWVGAEHRLKDWTLGCVAVTNEEIDEIWQAIPDGAVVEIRP